MIPYNRISSRPLKPWNFYTYTANAEKNFLARFNDKNSFEFLHYLIRYCCENNQGEWPDKITDNMIGFMIRDKGSPIVVEELLIFKEGFIVKEHSYYVLTHEFIVGSYLQCGDGNGFPLSAGHIDFTQEENLAEVLRTWIGIGEPQAVKFLVKLVASMEARRGLLFTRNFTLEDLLVVTREHGLIFELCLDWATKAGLIADHSPDEISCNGLMLVAYLAMPKL